MIKIAIIDINTKLLNNLAIDINAFTDCEVIYKLNNIINLETLFAVLTPAIVIIDIAKDTNNTIGAIKLITTKFPETHCIIYSLKADLDLVLKCMQAGAKGYFVKEKDTVENIVENIRLLNSPNFNEAFLLNGSIAKKILMYYANSEESFDQKIKKYSLTPRQTEILKQLYNGKSYKQIAIKLEISKDTLNSHIRAIYPKMKIKNRMEINKLLD